jgi:argininosuccinate lyase
VVPGLEINEQACLAACSDEVYAAGEACRLAAEGMPFRDAYVQVARQLQDGSFKRGAATTSKGVAEAVHRVLTDAGVTLADSKKWISDRRRFLSSTTERLFDWP